jgi:hypothetical protein
MGSGSVYAPLGVSVAVLLFIGLIFPYILGMFISVNDVKPSSFAGTLADLVDNGFSASIPIIGSVQINPFSWLGSTVQDTLYNSLTYLGILPNFIVIFIIVMCIISIVYSIIKLLPG